MALPRRPWTEPLSSPANAKAKLRRAFRSKTGAAPLRRGLGAWVTVPEECRDRCKLRKLSTQTAADSTGKRPAISWAKKERRTVNRAGRSPAVEALGRRAPQGGAFPSPGSLIRLASGRAGGGRGLGLGAFAAPPMMARFYSHGPLAAMGVASTVCGSARAIRVPLAARRGKSSMRPRRPPRAGFALIVFVSAGCHCGRTCVSSCSSWYSPRRRSCSVPGHLSRTLCQPAPDTSRN